MKKYVIIGNSIAAVGCIEGIRSIDKDGSICVISDEKYFVYGRPLISYLLMGKTSLDKMNYRSETFYTDNNVETKLGVKAVSIDKDKKVVAINNGEEISYDKLMLATGSNPFLPPMKGIETVKNVFSFMKLDDALALENVLNENSKVLVIGAGLIGLKCVEGIKNKVKDITVVDMANRVLPSILDETGSAFVKEYLEDVGVKFVLSDSIAEFNGNHAKSNTGKEFDFDILVTAVGVRPNTQLFSNIGGTVNRGIVIDHNGKTSIEDIYAGGDCCVSHDISCDQDRIVAIIPNAYYEGKSAGCAMAGEAHSFDKAMPMNSIGFFGLHIVTAGSYVGNADVVKNDNEGYKVLFTQDDLLKGFIIIGDISRVGIYTSLIRDKIKLSSIDYSLVREKPQLMAFSTTERIEKLGRAH